MDPKTLAHSIRSLTPLTLVVSSEPLDVARAMAVMLPRFTEEGLVRVAARGGIVDLKRYTTGDTFRPHEIQKVIEDEKKPERRAEWRDEKRPATWNEAVALIDEVTAQDPKDRQLVYLFPDLWPFLSDPHVLHGLQRFHSQRTADPVCIKMAVILVPSTKFVAEPFRGWFDIHTDGGLTKEQALDELTHNMKSLGLSFSEEQLVEFAEASVGLSTGDLYRMLASSVISVRARLKATSSDTLSNVDAGHRMTADDFRAWRKEHHKERAA